MFSPEDKTKSKRKIVLLCPGAKVTLAKPEKKRHARARLEMQRV
jgi:hypothetical protein